MDNGNQVHYNGNQNYVQQRINEFQQQPVNLGLTMATAKTALRPPKNRNLIN